MMSRELVEFYYNKFIHEDYIYYDGWYHEYRLACRYLNQVRESVERHGFSPQVVVGEEKMGIQAQNLRSFYDYFWRVRANGISGIGQGNFSKEQFQHLLAYQKDGVGFDQLVNQILLNPGGTYEQTIEWFKAWRDNTPNSKISWTSINRFYAAVLPGKLTTVVDDGKINYLFKMLGIPTEERNWFQKNQVLLSLLPEDNRADDCQKGIFFWYLYECFVNPMHIKKQMIFYGSPGTGKTYTAKKMARDHFEFWKIKAGAMEMAFEEKVEVVQFHPSFTYEDFMEGIRPATLEGGKSSLSLMDGVFKQFCRKAAKWELEYRKASQSQKPFTEVTVGEIRKWFPEMDGMWSQMRDKPDQSPAADYIPPFFFIIDEINRAELSRVFGELMYCLEYRGYLGKIKTQYSGLVHSEDDPANYYRENNSSFFFIPDNVFILGTMNTIDRSIESFDFALRRRFAWKEVKPDLALLQSYLAKNKVARGDASSIAERLKKLNQKITQDPLLGPDFAIGQTYLFDIIHYSKQMSATDVRQAVWDHNIKPLLEEYFRGMGEHSVIQARIEGFAQAFGVGSED